MLWLASGRANAQVSTALVRTGKKIENSFLTIDRSGLLWMATANGLVDFDRNREQFTTYAEAMVFQPVLYTAFSRVPAEIG